MAVELSQFCRSWRYCFAGYLRRRRRLCFWFGLFVCLFVCLSVGLLANLSTDFDEIFWRGRAWLKDQVIQFWWRSGSRFGSGSPKSEIRILRIGGGLCCLSISSFICCGSLNAEIAAARTCIDPVTAHRPLYIATVACGFWVRTIN